MTLEISCSISSLMALPSLICGRTLSFRPTSSRLMVWKGLVGVEAVPVVVKEPVTKGRFSPTTISASSLSMVTMFGVESTLVLLSEASARSSAPKSVPAPPMFPTTIARPLLRVSPLPAWALATLPARPLRPPKSTVPIGARPELLPPLVPSTNHSTPSSRLWSRETSAMMVSTSTWARGMSSLAITACRERN